MEFFRNLAYGTYVGQFPMVAIAGFITYASILLTAMMVSGKRWSKRLRRIPVRVHRWMALWALAWATLHLLMGVSAYV